MKKRRKAGGREEEWDGASHSTPLCVKETMAALKRHRDGQKEEAERHRDRKTEIGGKKQGNKANEVRSSFLHRWYFKPHFHPNPLTADYTCQEQTACWAANLHHSAHLRGHCVTHLQSESPKVSEL